jgi:hypothetical protein
MGLTEAILASGAFPAPLRRGRDDTLELEAVVAERQVFLSTRKLTYRCRLRADNAARRVTCYEILVEKGSGLSAGSDMAPGFGFRTESYSLAGKSREGTIEEQSRLFGRDYAGTFDFGALRRVAERMAAEAGYAFEVVLRERSV